MSDMYSFRIYARAGRLGGFLFIFFLFSCTPDVMQRAVGYVRLGAAAEFSGSEHYLESRRLYLRRDEGGFSVMSTMCTKDLSTLRKERVEGEIVWRSNFSGSSYDQYGNVLDNSAAGNLPYYRLVLYASVPGGERDTLFAQIGTEVDRDWRLPYQGNN